MSSSSPMDDQLVMCSCGSITSCTTSWTRRNPGRHFYCCKKKVSLFRVFVPPFLPSNNPTICREGGVGLLHGQIHQCALGRLKLFLDCCRDVTSMKKLKNQEQKRISS
ncbi:hypothetical protein R6Q57_001945 [Mikania cordata]